jgi:hypothetical protein
VPKEKLCPLMQKPCIEHDCKFYVHILGMNPQTEKMEDKFDCTFAWLPILLIENTQMQRQTGAAIETFRNVHAAGAELVAGTLDNLAEVARRRALPVNASG